MKLLSSLISLCVGGGVPRGEHYDWADGIVILDTSNFYQIYNSSTSWAVLYYSKWCTHCNSFAPHFKDFALDIKDWSPWLRVAAIDCASVSSVEGEDNGQDICFKQPYIITSMPDLRFYPAHTPRKSNERDNHPGVKRVLNLTTISRGTVDIWDGTNADDLRQLALEFASTKLDKSLVHFKPLKSLDIINQRQIGQNLVIFIEHRSSLSMKTAQMDMAGYENITIRRVDIKSETATSLTSQFGLELEDCLLVFNDEHAEVPMVRKYPGFSIRGFIRDQLRQLPNLVAPVYEKVEHELEDDQLTRLEQYRSNLAPADPARIYMQDIESALYYIFKKESAAKAEYTEEEEAALRSLVRIVDEYLPTRPMVKKFFKKLNGLFEKMNNDLNHDAYQSMLKRGDAGVGSLLPNREHYVACAGSKPIYRGFPCSKWQLWHLLSCRIYQSGKEGEGMKLLNTMRKYVTNFFTCEHCRNHFRDATNDLESLQLSNKDAVLHLWKLHNDVNIRIANGPTDDPMYPHGTWPNSSACSSCFNDDGVANLDVVFDYLISFYNENNISLDHILVKEKGDDLRSGLNLGLSLVYFRRQCFNHVSELTSSVTSCE